MECTKVHAVNLQSDLVSGEVLVGVWKCPQRE